MACQMNLWAKKLSGTYRRGNYQLMTALPPTKENMICFGNIICCSLPTLLAGHKQDTTQAYMLSQVHRMAAVTMV